METTYLKIQIQLAPSGCLVDFDEFNELCYPITRYILNPFLSNVPIMYHLKHHKTKDFLKFSGAIK